MMQRLDSKVPPPPQELTGAGLEVAREALARLIESARQTQDLLNQSVDVVASGAGEFHDMAVRHASEHLHLSFLLAQGLSSAHGLDEVLGLQRGFARQTAEAYARQIRELSRFMTQFSPNASARTTLE